jgi:hypothetical protein
MTSPLSPAAQAVLDSFNQEKGWFFPVEIVGSKVAAALRAAADQVIPTTTDVRLSMARYSLLAIAAELEAQP